MYIPAAFAETDQFKLHDFIEQNSFGLLVSQSTGSRSPRICRFSSNVSQDREAH